MNRLTLLIVFLSLSLLRANAQEAAPPVVATGTVTNDVAHEQLRKLRHDLESVVESGDWESLTPFLTQHIIVTWLDGTQSHTPSEVVAYLESKMGGSPPIVEKFSLQVDVKELSDLYGDDTALAFGTATSSFVLRGNEVSMSGPWSATMVREGDAWKLASLSASVGAFDNPLLTWTWRLVWVAGGVCGLIGILIGWFLGRRKPARKPSDGVL